MASPPMKGSRVFSNKKYGKVRILQMNRFNSIEEKKRNCIMNISSHLLLNAETGERERDVELAKAISGFLSQDGIVLMKLDLSLKEKSKCNISTSNRQQQFWE